MPVLCGTPLFTKLDPRKVYHHVLRFSPWGVKRSETPTKHTVPVGSEFHCKDVNKGQLAFRNHWKGISGIYKITFLPFRMFTYYGSTKDFAQRLKYHYYNGPKQNNFLGLFLSVFGWSCFSITIVEVCSISDLAPRENWYLTHFKPLLNSAMVAYAMKSFTISALTRSKISMANLDYVHNPNQDVNTALNHVRK